MLALLGAFVTSCRAEGPPDLASLDSAQISRPRLVLVDRRTRAEELALMPADLREAWCPAYDGREPTPISRLRDLPHGPDTSSERFALAIMQDAAASLAGDPMATDRLVALLDHWARANALRGGDRRAANRNYALDRTLLPTIVAFSLVDERSVLEPATRERIQRWLGYLVESRRRPPDEDVTNHNNHHYLRGSVDIAWGALAGDEGRFRSGIATYVEALRAMRPDGSLPLETGRGARALWYQRHAIASLVVTAEIAANQGVDLYGLAIEGRDLHAAIRYLLDALDDPGKVRAYALANDNPGIDRDPSDQDLSFLATRGHERHYMAWVEIYAARFPERPETRRLLALLEHTDSDFRPMIDDYSGGATTCLFARP
jgi:poly(beta-D-mannuronate) lyase